MSESIQHVIRIYKQHAAKLEELLQKSKNPIVNKAVKKAKLIVEELEQDRVLSPVEITNAIARNVWSRINLATDTQNMNDEAKIRIIMEEFLNLHGFIGPIVIDGKQIFQFETNKTGNHPYEFSYWIKEREFEECRFFIIELVRKKYAVDNIQRNLRYGTCAIDQVLIPAMRNEDSEFVQIYTILKQLYTDLKSTFSYLGRDKTPTNSSLLDAVEAAQEAVRGVGWPVSDGE